MKNKQISSSTNEFELARISAQALGKFNLKKMNAIKIMVETNKNHSSPIFLPISAFNLLIDALDQIAHGNSVKLICIWHYKNGIYNSTSCRNAKCISTIFNRVTRKKKIPFRKVGTRRKILIQDIIDYKNKIDNERKKILDELTEDAQKLGLGY